MTRVDAQSNDTLAEPTSTTHNRIIHHTSQRIIQQFASADEAPFVDKFIIPGSTSSQQDAIFDMFILRMQHYFEAIQLDMRTRFQHWHFMTVIARALDGQLAHQEQYAQNDEAMTEQSDTTSDLENAALAAEAYAFVILKRMQEVGHVPTPHSVRTDKLAEPESKFPPTSLKDEVVRIEQTGKNERTAINKANNREEHSSQSRSQLQPQSRFQRFAKSQDDNHSWKKRQQQVLL
jgi:hypothetical protein